MKLRKIALLALAIVVAFAAGHVHAMAGYKQDFHDQLWFAVNDIIAFAESHDQQACVQIIATSTAPSGNQFTREAFRCP